MRLSFLHGVVWSFAPLLLSHPKQKIRLATARFLPMVSSAPSSFQLGIAFRSNGSSNTYLQTKTRETVEEYVEAEDLDGLQDLFNRCCDQEGLMTKNAVQQIPAIAELLVGDTTVQLIEQDSQ